MTQPSSNLYRHLVSSARSAAYAFHGTRTGVARLLHRMSGAGVFLLGEASHGTQDFYHLRASITKHLIEHRGLTAVAVEADWPDAYRVNRFVRGEGPDADANAALSGLVAEEEFFIAEQNARLAQNAEKYYRAMFRGRHSSWNIRDTHMADTFDALMQFLSRHGEPAKVAVWAHNSHLGDARATEMGERGEVNLGQLLRQRYGDDVRSIGFTTHEGTVTAASDWDAAVERKVVRPAIEGSVEYLMHAVRLPQFVLYLHDEQLGGFVSPLLERAIGVIYRPRTERQSHYFNARVTEQFDALIHIDRTTAVVPLEPSVNWYHEEVPETYPSGL